MKIKDFKMVFTVFKYYYSIFKMPIQFNNKKFINSDNKEMNYDTSDSDNNDNKEMDYNTNESDNNDTDDNNDNSDNEAKNIQKKSINRKTVTKINKNLKKSDIRNIIFERINNKFSYGKYGPFVVVIMEGNGYINATKLCKLDKNKRFVDWKVNKSSKLLISETSKLKNIPENELIININGGSNTVISGAYVHEDLITDIAYWISLKFKMLVSTIIKAKFAQDFLKEKQDLIDECNEKDDKIDEMSKEIKKQTKMIKDIGLTLKDVKGQNVELLDNNKNMKSNLKKLTLKQQKILDGVDGLCKNLVIPTTEKGDNNRLIIIKNNEADSDQEDAAEIFEYTVLKMQQNIVKKKISSHLQLYPDSEVIVNLVNPNARTLWKNIKFKLKNKISVKNSRFNLKKNYTEQNLIRDIKKVHAKRYEHNLDSDEDDD
jgi:hypothetical protein